MGVSGDRTNHVHNKRLKRDCQRLATLVQNCSSVFTVCFLSSVVRYQPLSRALCLITKNQLVASFHCSFGFLVLFLSASWLRLALFSGHLFFGAGNSENCLSQFSSKREVGAAGSISISTTSFWG